MQSFRETFVPTLILAPTLLMIAPRIAAYYGVAGHVKSYFRKTLAIMIQRACTRSTHTTGIPVKNFIFMKRDVLNHGALARREDSTRPATPGYFPHFPASVVIFQGAEASSTGQGSDRRAVRCFPRGNSGCCSGARMYLLKAFFSGST